MNVVFHINEEAKWKMALANVKNFLREEADAKITVVANGPSVQLYTTGNEDILKLSEKVDFVACNNSLNGMKIDPEELAEGVRIVKAGVVEIAQKQIDGYAYIRP